MSRTHVPYIRTAYEMAWNMLHDPEIVDEQTLCEAMLEELNDDKELHTGVLHAFNNEPHLVTTMIDFVAQVVWDEHEKPKKMKFVDRMPGTSCRPDYCSDRETDDDEKYDARDKEVEEIAVIKQTWFPETSNLHASVVVPRRDDLLRECRKK